MIGHVFPIPFAVGLRFLAKVLPKSDPQARVPLGPFSVQHEVRLDVRS
jgi:hypothetical protein